MNKIFGKRQGLFCLVLLNLLFIINLAGCSDSNIEVVKTGSMNFDTSTTVGNVLDNYPYFATTTWKSFEDAQKRQIVEFNGTLNHIEMLQNFIKDLSQDKNGETGLALMLMGVPSTQHLVKAMENPNNLLHSGKWTVMIQFTILPDNRFNISYVGFEDADGQHEKSNIDLVKSIYRGECLFSKSLLQALIK
ncbi:hypothetical protein [Desulfovibrio litoralis]|uniref:Uncharacterized protein n=1 Tax=Desulfovibrio litoralis DSM 11393 TaxID=1121455 RepID=A0A1M7S119_9BACT|nr:hypothetical protein [Desulfovibrio litoralis]SHN51982.1 hypothetical protein SAMN02745728_00405 [Desulfovibrio litoralis DSM 11393]